MESFAFCAGHVLSLKTPLNKVLIQHFFTLVVAFGRILLFADCLLLLTISFEKGIDLKFFAVFGGVFCFLYENHEFFPGFYIAPQS